MQLQEFYCHKGNLLTENLPVLLQPTIEKIAELSHVSKIIVFQEKNETHIICLFIPNSRPIIVNEILTLIDRGTFKIVSEKLQQQNRLFKAAIKYRNSLLN